MRLERPEVRVEAAFGEELVVTALLRDLATVEDNNAIHLTDRREPVRDDDDGLSFHERVEGILDQEL